MRSPICAHRYAGYGKFGDTDAHIWLAKMNIDPKIFNTLTEEERIMAGISLSCGIYLEDKDTKKRIAIYHPVSDGLTPYPDLYYSQSYIEALPGYDGKSANELMETGQLIPKNYNCPFPIKVSYNKDAIYEELPASPDCPDSGLSLP